MQASCEAFHISHTPALADASASMAADPQESPLWLVKSPSGNAWQEGFSLGQKPSKVQAHC